MSYTIQDEVNVDFAAEIRGGVITFESEAETAKRKLVSADGSVIAEAIAHNSVKVLDKPAAKLWFEATGGGEFTRLALETALAEALAGADELLAAAQAPAHVEAVRGMLKSGGWTCYRIAGNDGATTALLLIAIGAQPNEDLEYDLPGNPVEIDADDWANAWADFRDRVYILQ